MLRSPRGATLTLTILLVAGTQALYAPVLRNGFVNYDDPGYVTANTHVRQGLSAHNIGWACTATEEANWHPLTWISHMADVQAFGLNPAGHHLISVLWHTLNVVLVFLLLRYATGYAARAAVVAALFALHPFNVESVAWVAERKSVLCTAFLLFTLWVYGRYVRRPTTRRYAAVILLVGLGLMAKPMIITLPFVLLLLDYWPLQRARTFAQLVVEKIPLFAMSVGSALITVYAQRRGGALGMTMVLPLILRIKNAIYCYAAYIFKGTWPSRLAVFYPHPENSLAWWKVIVAAALLVVISALAWRYRERRVPLVGWLWYLGTMAPVIGLVQIGRQGMADRYTYIPLLGLFVIVVWLGAELTKRIGLSNLAVGVITLAVLFGYASVSYRQIGYWRDSYTLFSHALRVTSDNSIAEDNLGAALAEMGKLDVAMPHFEAAIRLAPQLSTPHYNLATLLHRQNRLEEAEHEYQLALTYTSDPLEAAQAHNNLGVLLTQMNQFDKALVEFSAAISINPGEQNSYLGRGALGYREGNLDAAFADFSRAAQISPSAAAWYWQGRVLEDKGQWKPAVQAYQEALRLAPGISDAQARLDAIRQKLPR
jgi:Tfp pilus assembly protein PilF